MLSGLVIEFPSLVNEVVTSPVFTVQATAEVCPNVYGGTGDEVIIIDGTALSTV